MDLRGVGVLYGKEEWLDRLPPYQGGGEMIERVSFTKTTFERPPLKFEAGTPDYIATTGLATASIMFQLWAWTLYKGMKKSSHVMPFHNSK